VTGVLVTGASGYVGRKLVRALAAEPGAYGRLVATDVRPPAERLAGVVYETHDVRAGGLAALLTRHEIDTVVHLATLVTPPKGTPREVQRDVDVGGTENVLAACLEAGVRRLVVTSSGAAYGYHPDLPPSIDEDTPLRGNEAFAYSHHKRLVEELLSRARREHPELEQLVFRPGTILGAGAQNQITDIFTRPVVVGLSTSESPFSFVWDEDVVRAIATGVREGWTGIYNLSGEGVLTLREIAAQLGKRFVGLPEAKLARALTLLSRAGLTELGPEQTAFLAHRPVLSSRRLRAERGLRLLPSREVFERWARGLGSSSRGPEGRRDERARVVVVTGAARGIGLAIARRFAATGARVALLDRDAERVTLEAARLVGEGREALGLACDVCDETACARAIAEVEATFGGVDVAVANAGISHRSLFRDTTPAVLRRVMEVNFFGAVHLTRAAMPSLIAQRGAVVAISSVAGFAPLLGRTGYAASKHALHGFFDSLRAEVEPLGVSVTLVCPSYTDTDIDRSALAGDGGAAGTDKATVGRLATPDEIAEAVFTGVQRRARSVLPTRLSQSAYWLSRLVPSLYATVMVRQQAGEFEPPR
jgi:UDP-glucose 4-epimerase